MSAGELRERVTFQKRGTYNDGYGNLEAGDWIDQFTVWARVRPRLGGETVIASRLAGTQPVTITVRHSAATTQVGTEWRAFDARAGNDDNGNPRIIYNIRSIVNPDEKRRYLDVLAETGVAT